MRENIRLRAFSPLSPPISAINASYPSAVVKSVIFFTPNAFASSLHPSILGELIGEGRRLQHILGR